MQAVRRAVIFANGEINEIAAASKVVLPDDYLIAADGGLRYCLAMGLIPHLLIGDLDSVSAHDVARLAAAGVEVKRFPIEKDETDLELALTAAVEAGYTVIRVLGSLGGRLDQTLANVFLLMLPVLDPCDVRLDDGLEEIFIIPPTASPTDLKEGSTSPDRLGIQVKGRAGDVVSLLPLNGPATGIRTDGLYFPLAGETLYPERSRGISNVMLSDEAAISLETGRLLCIHSRQPFPSPNESI